MCRWLRAKGKGEVTAEHADYYYFRGNTDIFAQNRADAGSGSSEAAAEDEAVSVSCRCSHMTPCLPCDVPCMMQLCQVCGESKDEDKTLICDLCDRGFHMYCMNPKLKSVPAGEWHCDACCNADFDMYTCWISMVSGSSSFPRFLDSPACQLFHRARSRLKTARWPCARARRRSRATSDRSTSWFVRDSAVCWHTHDVVLAVVQ